MSLFLELILTLGIVLAIAVFELLPLYREKWREQKAKREAREEDNG